MRKIIIVIFVVTLGCGFVISDFTPVIAQDDFLLEEITVTAQKREENQQKVAVPIEVVTGEEIKELGRTDIEDILSNITGVVINKNPDGLRVSIHGISDDNRAERVGVQSSTPTIAVNQDGVNTARKNSGIGLYDLERVEVMLGPQATLYASNTPGGIVNLVTATPKLDVFEVSGTVEYGNYDLLRMEGAMNAPVSETTALRAAFYSTVRDGYLTNGSDDENGRSARLRALIQPNESFSFLITGELEKTMTRGIAAVNTFVNQADVPNPWTAQASAPDNPSTQNQRKIYGNITYDAGFGSLTLIPAYVTRNYDLTSVRTEGSTQITSYSSGANRERGVEGRLVSSPYSNIKWITGFNWYESVDRSATNSTNGSWNTNFIQMKSHAFYGNITYPVTDVLRITGGARKSWDTNDTNHVEFPNRTDPTSADPTVENVTMEYASPDYKIGFEYDFAENSMLYADYSSSYRTQGSAFDQYGNPFPPEKLKAISVGSKNRFLGNKLQLNASAFYYKYNDYFAQGLVSTISRKDINGDGDYDDLDLVDPDTGLSRNETIRVQDEAAKQVGDANLLGVDLTISAIITAKDMLNLSVSYLDTEFTSLYFDYWDITNEIGVPDMDYTGKEMTYSPKWTASANYSHNFNLQNGGILTARVDANYQSSYIMTFNDVTVSLDSNWQASVADISKEREQEAYHLTDLSLIYTSPEGKWMITGYLKNLENYAVKKSWGHNRVFVIGPPRTYGAILSIKY